MKATESSPAEYHLRRLIDDPWNSAGKAATAADFFLRAVQEGDDISAHVAALEAAFLEHTQLAVLTPLADALCLHFLKRGELELLSSLLASRHFFQYVIDSLRRLEKARVDIGAAIPGLIRHGGAASVLIPYLKRSKRRLLPVLEAMLAEPSARPAIAGLLSDYLLDGAPDLADAMPILVSLFDEGSISQKEAIAQTLRLAAEQGTGLQQVTPQMERFLELKNETVQSRVAYALAWSHARENHWTDIDRLLAHRATDVRFGVAWALSVTLNTQPSCAPELAARLAAALADEAAVVRNFALNGLKKAEAQAKSVSPDRQTFVFLSGKIDDPLTGPAIVDYQYSCCTKDRALASVLVETLTHAQVEKENPLLHGLLRVCREIEAGTHVAACLICEQLPRNQTYSHDSDVPTAAHLLAASSCGNLEQCPACGTHYVHTRTEEYLSPSDGMGSEIDIVIRRLCPTELLDRLKGQAREDFLSRQDIRVQKLLHELNHPRGWLRDDAAWALTVHFLRHKQTEAITMLLRHPLAGVRFNSAQTIKTAVEEGLDPAAWRDELLALLSDKTTPVRACAAAILALWHLRSAHHGDMDTLLNLTDVTVKQAVLFRIQAAAREGMDISRFLAALRRALSDPDETVRCYARWALDHAPQDEQARTIASMIDKLADPRLEIRKEAIDALCAAAQNEIDISAGLPQLAKALGVNELRWHAMKALQAAAAKGVDTSIAIPAIVAILADKKVTMYKDDFILLLESMAQHRFDISPAIPALAKATADDRIKGLALQVLLLLAGQRVSLAKAIPTLNKTLSDHDAYSRQECVKALSTEFINTANWKAIGGLLSHARNDVRAVAAQRLGEMALEPIDNDLVALLLENLLPASGSYEYRSFCTKGALIALAGKDKAAARHILDALTRTKRNAAQKACREVIAACENALA